VANMSQAMPDQKRLPLRVMNNIGGYSTVVATWPRPCFVLKEASTGPKVVTLNGESLNSINAFHTATCNRGFMALDSTVCVRWNYALL
jgi:cleavage and polyadenylation specificity factor subunit 1